MTPATIIVTAIIAVIFTAVVVSEIRKRKQGKSSCGCGCANCPSGGSCHRK